MLAHLVQHRRHRRAQRDAVDRHPERGARPSSPRSSTAISSAVRCGSVADPPVLDQLLAVEQPEHGVRVARRRSPAASATRRAAPSTLSISRVVPTRAATASSAGPAVPSGTSVQRGRVDQREVVEPPRRARRRARRGPPGVRHRRRSAARSDAARSARDRASATPRSAVGEVDVAAGQRQPVGVAHGRHRRRPRPGS